MLFLLILFLSSVFTSHCMEAPVHGKRKGGDLVPVAKGARTENYGVPTLDGIPDDLKRKILEDAMLKKDENDGNLVNQVVKTNHPYFRISRSFKRVGEETIKKLYKELGTSFPRQMRAVISKMSFSSGNLTYLRRFIESTPSLVFDLTPRISPLMVAVGYNNITAVRLLLHGAKQRGCLDTYLDLNSGEYPKDAGDVLEPDEERPPLPPLYPKGTTALHIAANAENSVPSEMLEVLLSAGANPNVLNREGSTPMQDTFPFLIETPDMATFEEKCSLLLQYGCIPTIGPVGETPLDFLQPVERNPEERDVYLRITKTTTHMNRLA